MVTDRVCTAALLALVAADFARAGRHAAASAALAALVLDVGAHWVQSAAAGALRAASHKALPDEPALLRWYYRRENLFAVCLLSEAHLASAFLLARAAAAREPLGALAAPLPLAPPAAWLGGAGAAGALLAAALPALPPAGAAAAGSAAAWLLALTLPAFALKQAISLLQLARAAQRIVEVDEAERGA
jgi:hypothetical protein